MQKWPKHVPPAPPELQRIHEDFMQHWLTVLPQRYGLVEKFNQLYPVRRAPAGFRRTLEVGAGLGEHLRYEVLTPEQEREYHALDVRPNLVEELRRRFPKVQALVGDCQTRLGFPDGHFDRILAIHVLEHLANLPAAIREMHRLCDKERGSFTVMIPCEGSLAYGLARRISAQRIFEKRYRIPYREFISREHLNQPREIMEELTPRFRVTHRAFYPFPVPLYFCNLLVGLTLAPRNGKG